MAVIKDRPTQFGVNASYHRIDKVELNTYANECVMHVATYASEEARRAGSDPLSVDRVIVPFWRMADDPRVPFYRLLEQFDGSPVFGGQADVEVEGGPEFGLLEYTPPPLPPAPTATSGPESVPGFIPQAQA
jgi:hypothetical protein